MSIPTSLTELPKPTDLLTVKSEVLCDPEDGVGISGELGLTEFLVETAGKSTESKTALKPGISPTESLVVVYILTRERTIFIILVNLTLRALTGTLGIGTLDKGDVNSSQSNVQADFSLDLDHSMNRGVGFVLGAHTLVVGVPGVGKVGHK